MRWLGYNKIQCTTPQRIRPHTNNSVHYFSQVHNLSDVHQNVTVFEMAVVRINSDGIHFIRASRDLHVQERDPEDIQCIPVQESGAHELEDRGAGKLRYINGTDFWPLII